MINYFDETVDLKNYPKTLFEFYKILNDKIDENITNSNNKMNAFIADTESAINIYKIIEILKSQEKKS